MIWYGGRGKEIQGDGRWAKSYGTGFSSGRPDRERLPVDWRPEEARRKGQAKRIRTKTSKLFLHVASSKSLCDLQLPSRTAQPEYTVGPAVYMIPSMWTEAFIACYRWMWPAHYDDRAAGVLEMAKCYVCYSAT